MSHAALVRECRSVHRICRTRASLLTSVAAVLAAVMPEPVATWQTHNTVLDEHCVFLRMLYVQDQNEQLVYQLVHCIACCKCETHHFQVHTCAPCLHCWSKGPSPEAYLLQMG